MAVTLFNKNYGKAICIVSLLLNVVFIGYGLYRLWQIQNNAAKHQVKQVGEYKGRDSLLVDKSFLYYDSTAIILTLGQSNSANEGQGIYNCHNAVFNYYNEKLFQAVEPLLGASGNGCSVWTRLSDMLIDSGLYKRVIIIPAGIGGTSIDCWAQGECNERFKQVLEHIMRDSIKVSHIIWHQGESDNIENTPKALYKAKLRKIYLQIRQYCSNAEFYVCVASFHPYLVDAQNEGIDTVIQNAQKEFVMETPGTKPGANTDLINMASDRYDGIHLSTRGLDKFAKAMYLAMYGR
mgnify:CR=1 FL=1